MDTLVARYSRPAASHNETLAEDQYDDFQNDITPSLSLKFAMPPVAQVSSQFNSSTASRCFIRIHKHPKMSRDQGIMGSRDSVFES